MAVDFAFLDSGVGGLPYLIHLLKKNPDASCIYVADTKNFPYGEKSSEQIIDCACEAAGKIIERWAPGEIVVACNTISVTALEALRKKFPKTVFVGTVPAIKPAALVSKTRKIGLLATNATVNHPYTQGLKTRFAPDCSLISRGDPDLISFIEHKFFTTSEEERLSAVRPAVDFFRNNGCDVIILACTHFLNMSDYIQKEAGESIKVVDSRDGVVRHALEMQNNSAKTSHSDAHEVKLFVTGFTQSNDSASYEKFCQNHGIKFGGVLDNND